MWWVPQIGATRDGAAGSRRAPGAGVTPTQEQDVPLPVYLVMPEGQERPAWAGALGGDSVVVPSLRALAGLPGPGAGLVVFPAGDVGTAELLEAADALYRASEGWVFAAVRENGGAPSLQVLSIGYPEEPAAAGAWAADPAAHPGRLLELRRALAEMSRARHDINNPLTSALAETQLLLMDAEDPEARESLGVVQTQLRRLRDLVAATGHLRPPRK